MLKNALRTTLFVVLATLSSHTLAASLLAVTVVSVQDNIVTVQVNDTLPDWVQNGSSVQAAGWESAIAAVDGKTFELHFQTSQADALQPHTTLFVRSEHDASDGLTCG